MFEEDEQEHGDFVANWDTRADELDDQPSEQNWRQLMMLPEEDRLKELLKRFRWAHKNENRQIKDVKITSELMPIVLHLEKLRFKNPDMLVAGFAVLDEMYEIDRDRLKTISKYLEKSIEKDKKVDMKPHILRYARLLQHAIQKQKIEI